MELCNELTANYDALIFDLDGTLWDTCESCAMAWNRVLIRNRFPFRKITADDVRAVTGMPHQDCIDAVFSELPIQQRRIICEQTMTEDNRVISQRGGKLYDGVENGIMALANRYKLAIVSNCQTGYIETFLAWHGLEQLFTDFECWGNTGQAKSNNLAGLIARNEFSKPVFIGDTASDQEAALNCQIPFIQVLYGFGKPLASALQVANFETLVRKFVP